MTENPPAWGSAPDPEPRWGGPLERVALPPRVKLNPAGFLAPARRPTARPATRLIVQHATASGGFVVLRAAELRRRMRRLEPAAPRHPYDIVSADRHGIRFAEPGTDARLELPWSAVSAVGIGTVGIDVRRVRAVMLRVAIGGKPVVVPLVVMELRRGVLWDVAEEDAFLAAYGILLRARPS